MERNKRLYPISEELFKEVVLPVIEGNYILQDRPPKIAHYQVFCGILYVLRTGCSWRDLPTEYGDWYVVYDRFSRGSERGLWAQVLLALQQEATRGFEAVIIDSTMMKVHRHGGGQKGVTRQKGNREQG